MARLPFEESEPDPPVSNRKDAALSVSEFTAEVRDVLAAGFRGKVRVVGEVSNFSNRQHWFFSLKDESATVRCVCFASAARRLGFVPDNGSQIVVTGRVDFYDAQGSLQIYVDRAEPVGRGALEAQLRELMEKLRERGYFDPEHKQELPLVPRRVAVVTSRNAAALQDVIDTTRQRWPGCRLTLCDVRVQGASAAPEVAAMINRISRQSGGKSMEKVGGFDAVIVTRGGGSIEDLWAFNDPEVAEAIYRCPIPVVAAIGHETDTTIAELVADLRCATPTQAAMAVVPDRAALSEQLSQLQRRVGTLLHRELRERRGWLDRTARHPMLVSPRRMVDPHRERLDRLEQQLTRGLADRLGRQTHTLRSLTQRLRASHPERQIDQARTRLDGLARRLMPATRRRHLAATQQLDAEERELDAVGPRRVLERGYTYTTDAEGNVLRDTDRAKAAGRLTTMFADGSVSSTVDGQAPARTPALPPSKPRPVRRRKKKQPDPNQHKLF